MSAIGSVLVAVLIAVKPALDRANTRLVKLANGVGWTEQVSIGLLGVSGVVAVLVSNLSFSQAWLWMSLMIVLFYSGALLLMTKPARLAVAEGGSSTKVGLQVGLQVGHVLLIIVAFALMFLKPL